MAGQHRHIQEINWGIMRRLAVFILILVNLSLFGEKLAQLPDIARPFQLWIDSNRFYVTEGATVFIYSLRDFRLETTFGIEGEGPREFKTPPGSPGVLLYPLDDFLVINSLGKVSFYGKEGSFIKEIRNPAGSAVSSYLPFGSQFVGLDIVALENSSFGYAFNFYNKDLSKTKEFHRLSFIQRGRMEFPSTPLLFNISGDKIIVAGPPDEFSIYIFDGKGHKTNTIQRNYQPIL